MTELSEQAKEEIVRRLACWEQPKDVQRIVGEMFFNNPKAISSSQLANLNPGVASFQGSQKWVYMFDAIRKAHLTEVASHAVSHVGFRLAMLQRAALKLEAQGNFIAMAAMLKQAQDEMGHGRGLAQGGGGDSAAVVNTNLDPRLPATAEEARAELIHKLENLRLRQIGAGKSNDVSGQF